VNFTTELHPVESVSTNLPLLEFVHLADLVVPMISIAQQLAEKLHAVMRTYSSGDSARAKDAFDTMLVAQTVGLPGAAALRKAVDRTFTIQATPVPVAPAGLPGDWFEPLRALLADFALPGIGGVDELEAAWTKVWTPILDGSCPDSATWNPDTFSWG